MADEPITTIFDADNHYWETHESFTRHRDPSYADRGLRLVEVDGVHKYYIGDRLHPILPGPGDEHGRPMPGALRDYFAGTGGPASLDALSGEDPSAHPEWFNRDARLACMDVQGVEGAWLFPSQGVCMEGPMQPDVEASVHILGAFNRWIDDEWGFAYRDRIFAVPFLTLSDVDAAVVELEWALARGARVVSIRNGPAFTPDGTKSPADPVFDPFWARVQESGVVVAPHAGFEDGYRAVEDAVARAWGYLSAQHTGDTTALTCVEPLVQMLMKHRLVHDFAAALVAHHLFERFGRLRVAFIENGADWVAPLLHGLQLLASQNPGMFSSSPVDQFIEHCWVAPFVEDRVEELARHLPVERILFGSDWPHAEGMAHPRDFLANVSSLPIDAQRRIMVDNARELTFA
ncbi:MAG TPA: amidohydrolase family protein [Mycobacteriales bacterium]|nr:amidohydrolase family protein [Mycobacteriales bacterium]